MSTIMGCVSRPRGSDLHLLAHPTQPTPASMRKNKTERPLVIVKWTPTREKTGIISPRDKSLSKNCPTEERPSQSRTMFKAAQQPPPSPPAPRLRRHAPAALQGQATPSQPSPRRSLPQHSHPYWHPQIHSHSHSDLPPYSRPYSCSHSHPYSHSHSHRHSHPPHQADKADTPSPAASSAARHSHPHPHRHHCHDRYGYGGDVAAAAAVAGPPAWARARTPAGQAWCRCMSTRGLSCRGGRGCQLGRSRRCCCFLGIGIGFGCSRRVGGGGRGRGVGVGRGVVGVVVGVVGSGGSWRGWRGGWVPGSCCCCLCCGRGGGRCWRCCRGWDNRC
jgi:hypothetical protein